MILDGFVSVHAGDPAVSIRYDRMRGFKESFYYEWPRCAVIG